jgi:hypothetical protein
VNKVIKPFSLQWKLHRNCGMAQVVEFFSFFLFFFLSFVCLFMWQSSYFSKCKTPSSNLSTWPSPKKQNKTKQNKTTKPPALHNSQPGFLVFFFFFSTKDWTQGLVHARQVLYFWPTSSAPPWLWLQRSSANHKMLRCSGCCFQDFPALWLY